MRKLFSSIVTVTTILTLSLNSFQSHLPKTNAVSYRSTSKLYGDINSDKTIDSFDVKGEDDFHIVK